jgi:hypothetical protein
MTSEQRSCAMKIRHATIGGARTALGAMMHTHNLPRGELVIYGCRFCHGWHIGHRLEHPEPVRKLKVK